MSPNLKLQRILVQQTVGEFVIEGPVISATCTEKDTHAERKRKDAEKPLYFKRV